MYEWASTFNQCKKKKMCTLFAGLSSEEERGQGRRHTLRDEGPQKGHAQRSELSVIHPKITHSSEQKQICTFWHDEWKIQNVFLAFFQSVIGSAPRWSATSWRRWSTRSSSSCTTPSRPRANSTSSWTFSGAGTSSQGCPRR